MVAACKGYIGQHGSFTSWGKEVLDVEVDWSSLCLEFHGDDKSEGITQFY